MRISSNQLAQLGIRAILDQQAQLSATQLQIATGKRVSKPSDDPAAAVRILSLRGAIEINAQYQTNADRATSRLTQEESTLNSMVTVLQRVRELAVQGNNATVSDIQRAAIAAEVDQRLDEFLSLSNTRDDVGEFIFAGFDTDNPPFERSGNVFSYSGDQGERRVQIGPDREISDRHTGFDVFMNAKDSTGASQDLFASILNFQSNMESNTPSGTDIDDIDVALDHILSIRTEIGGRLNAIDSQKAINDSRVLSAQEALSALEDLDLAEAIGRFNQQLVSFQAAEQAFARVQNLSLFNFL